MSACAHWFASTHYDNSVIRWDHLPANAAKGFVLVERWRKRTSTDECKFFDGAPEQVTVQLRGENGWQLLGFNQELFALPSGNHHIRVCHGQSNTTVQQGMGYKSVQKDYGAECRPTWYASHLTPVELDLLVEPGRAVVVRATERIEVDCGGIFKGDETSSVTLDAEPVAAVPYSGTVGDLPDLEPFLRSSSSGTLMIAFDNLCRIGLVDKQRATQSLNSLPQDGYLVKKTREQIQRQDSTCLIPMNPKSVTSDWTGTSVEN